MNFLLIEPDELTADGTAVLRGRRAEHVRTVLRAGVGQQLRAGVIDGRLGSATITACTDTETRVTVQLDRDPPVARDWLLLAVPRPKVLLRMLAHAAALGFGHVVLFRSWRVDKSWLASSAMDPAVQRAQLVLGLEQAGRTRLPSLHAFPLFRPMVEDALPQLELPSTRFVAHPTAVSATWQLAPLPELPFALALGPDGGFLPYEIEQLSRAGFAPVSCGPHPLRTETALAVLWGQLDLLRQRR